MPRTLSPASSLDNLRKEAKRWLKALREGREEARARLRRAWPGAPADPGLRGVQQALAREHGLASWAALQEELARRATVEPRDHRLYAIDRKENRIAPRQPPAAGEWDALIAVMQERRIPSLAARGWMTDDVLARVADLDFVTRLRLGGSQELSDDGLRHLARMPQLQHLEISEHPGGRLTDRGLEVLRHLPDLRTFEMTWQAGISDAGVMNLQGCERLESVNLMGTPTGDGAIAALSGKPALRSFKSGRLVTDAGLARLRDFPAFREWRGGEVRLSLMGAEAEPTHLMIDGPFTDAGLASLAGLEGLFALSFFWHVPALTAAGLKVLAELPNLGSLGCQEELCDDAAMREIAALPRLRHLMCQGTVAGDDGFLALSRSRTIEHLWGRDCPNLTGRGFAALARMPALRGLAVSCKNVGDGALGLLPDFPALRELLPMDVTDEGFRHVGACTRLQSLWCMYCRDTTDAATEHLAGLEHLTQYYAGKTKITDRSLEILSRMPSLERLTFWQVAGITDAGLRALARLPRLREVKLDGVPNVTLEGTAVFPHGVDVDYSP